MQLNSYPTSSTGANVISFPKLESWNMLTEVATIAAQVNKRRVLCRISMEILHEKFGDSEGEPMQSVALYRNAIEKAARKLIESDRFEEDGSILIRAGDL